MQYSIPAYARTYTQEQIGQIKTELDQQGYCHIASAITTEEIGALKDAVDRLFSDAKWQKTHNVSEGLIGQRLFETDPVFEDLLTREPIIDVIESILGADCHLIAQNVIRNAPGQLNDEFHVDDQLYLPVSEGLARHVARWRVPIFVLSVAIPLTDIPTEAFGPTQIVPGSHYSGQLPNDPNVPSFEGHGPVSILCRAGDMYFFNGQCWHRGGPNSSQCTRYLLGMTFGRRWVAQRFYPFVNYQLPAHVALHADERRKRVLGLHPPGPFAY